MSDRDESEWQEQHRDASQYLDVVALLDGPPALADTGPAEQLLSEREYLVACPLVLLVHGIELQYRLFQVVPHRCHELLIRRLPRGVLVRVRPDGPVSPLPEIVLEGVKIGGTHRLYAVVDDAQCVVGPEITARIRKVRVFEQEFVTQFDVKHELALTFCKHWHHTDQDEVVANSPVG